MSAQVFFSQILATSDKPVCPHWHERKALSFQFTRPSTDTYFVLRQKTEPRFNISFPCYYYLNSSHWRDLSDSNHVYEYSGRYRFYGEIWRARPLFETFWQVAQLQFPQENSSNNDTKHLELFAQQNLGLTKLRNQQWLQQGLRTWFYTEAQDSEEIISAYYLTEVSGQILLLRFVHYINQPSDASTAKCLAAQDQLFSQSYWIERQPVEGGLTIDKLIPERTAFVAENQPVADGLYRCTFINGRWQVLTHEPMLNLSQMQQLSHETLQKLDSHLVVLVADWQPSIQLAANEQIALTYQHLHSVMHNRIDFYILWGSEHSHAYLQQEIYKFWLSQLEPQRTFIIASGKRAKLVAKQVSQHSPSDQAIHHFYFINTLGCKEAEIKNMLKGRLSQGSSCQVAANETEVFLDIVAGSRFIKEQFQWLFMVLTIILVFPFFLSNKIFDAPLLPYLYAGLSDNWVIQTLTAAVISLTILKAFFVGLFKRRQSSDNGKVI